ncbi:hypothetical protein NPX99_00295 [Bartonella sp. 220]|uniref:hypothetical protein n=1 Tax=Bartonella sp. 220B TaxID=2967260 RepID=UPI0022A92068|nr:hypothetical protein [Bartonella sp. 220B]MCZ2157730.1 hypothetical protein [Bartonella sp. 220B]
MKHIILAAAFFSIFSSVLSPIMASAAPMGKGCGRPIVDKLVERGKLKSNIQEYEKTLLSNVIVPEMKSFFRKTYDKFQVTVFTYPILRSLGFKSNCAPVNAHLRNIDYLYFSCSVD